MWPGSQNLLPVRFQALAWWAYQLPLEGAAPGYHGGQCGREVLAASPGLGVVVPFPLCRHVWALLQGGASGSTFIKWGQGRLVSSGPQPFQ